MKGIFAGSEEVLNASLSLDFPKLKDEELCLLRSARPGEYAESFFNHHMQVANVLGMTRAQALRYVADRRVENGKWVIATLLTCSQLPGEGLEQAPVQQQMLDTRCVCLQGDPEIPRRS